MNQLPRSPLHSSVFAIVVTALAVLLSFVFGPFLSPDAYLLFIAAVWASTWFHGRTGGFVATGFPRSCSSFTILAPGYRGIRPLPPCGGPSPFCC